MSYSYAGQLTYGPQNYPLSYNNLPGDQPNYSVQTYPTSVEIPQQAETAKKPAAPMVTLGAAAGFGVGTIAGLKKRPFITDGGNVNDKFAVNVYEKYLKKVPNAGKAEYEQTLNMLKKIDTVNSPESLRTLFAENPEAAKEACSALNKTPEKFLDNVTNRNLKHNKKAIKSKLQSANATRIQDIKNDITALWNVDKKKFEKPAGDTNLYKIVKKTSAQMKGAAVGKAMAIGTAIGGVSGFLLHKLLNVKTNAPKQN